MNSLRKISLSDIELLQQLSISTFSETYSADNKAEDLQQYLNTNFNLHQLASELNNPEAAFYFAMENQTPVGYLKVNTGEAQTELKNKRALEIERIYVKKSFQGKRVGKALFEKALQLAKDIRAPYIWLGVWEKNKKAIQFYKKNGFVVFDKHIFKLGTDEQTDLLMKIELDYKV